MNKLPDVIIIEKESPLFPQNLLVLKDCPKKLYLIGNEKILNKLSISIVGTRKSSSLGNEIAYDLANSIAKNDIVIVSGGASGIDTYAHNGAIQNGKTIMYVAGGFNTILKGSKYTMALKIIECGGSIISEYDLNTPPQDFTFLERNRLIAVHSEATIVVEAPIKSGSLNTASHARNYGKKVFSVPWSINYSNGKGNLFLYSYEASPLVSYKDILNYLNSIANFNLFNDFETTTKTTPCVPEKYKIYYDFIKDNSPIYIDGIYSFFNTKSVSEINSILLFLEMDDLIYSINDEYFVK